MQRKKTPLLSHLPLVLHSSCSTKLSNAFSVCRSPGPFLALSSPSFVTSNLVADRLGSSNTFQPVRSLPLKRGLASSWRNLRERISIVPPLGALRESWNDSLS